MTNRMTVREFEERFPEAFKRWVQGLIISSNDEFFIARDGRPGFWAADGGGAQSDPCFIWQPELNDFDEEYERE